METPTMSDEVDFPGIPAREDCSSCPETGTRCALHQNMYHRALKRQQEAGLVVQAEQAHGDQLGGDDNQTAEMSKRALNRAKTQEGQMINVSLCNLLQCPHLVMIRSINTDHG